jgi:hypothetical protein
VNEAKNGGIGRVLGERFNDGAVSEEVAIELTGLDIEDVDEDFDVLEDVVALGSEVVIHECILTGSSSSVRCMYIDVN